MRANVNALARNLLVRFFAMQSDAEPRGGPLAARPDAGASGSALAQQPPLTGGVGLFDHSARDPFSPSAGAWAGVIGLLIVLVSAGALIYANPAFSNGKAGGEPDQLGQPVAATGSGPAAEGQALIANKPCGTCHAIPGVQGANGTVGPNLAGVASRTTIAGGAVPNNGPDDLKAWIMNPPGVKPGTAMPNYNLTDDEATKIVAYLETLK
jgi:cytochrome c1